MMFTEAHPQGYKHTRIKCTRYNANVYIKKHYRGERILYKKSKILLKPKKILMYTYKSKNSTLSFTKHLCVKNGFIYMLLENIIFLNYLINQYNFQFLFSFMKLKKDILEISKESNKKNGIIKITIKPYKTALFTFDSRVIFMILFFPIKKKKFSRIDLKVLRVQDQYLDLNCLFFLQNINDVTTYFKRKSIKIITVDRFSNISPLFNGILGTLENKTLYFFCNKIGGKNPNFLKIINSLKNINNKTRDMNHSNFDQIKIVMHTIPEKYYSFSNCFIINDDLSIDLIKQINQRNTIQTASSEMVAIIQFLIDEELIPRQNVFRHTPVPYFD